MSNQIDATMVDALGTSVVYFGHQSVGTNILQGVATLAGDTGVPRVIAYEPGIAVEPGTILHGPVGANGDMYAKIDSFAETIRNGVGEIVDVALFKFCYVDVRADTDVETVFAYYQRTMEELEREYPNVRFVHSTIPLVSRPLPLFAHAKNVAKWILRRDPLSNKSNSVRNEFNMLVRNNFGDTERLFDIAELESSRVHEERAHTSRETGGHMLRRYTYDGGHLNRRGQTRVASGFLETIGRIVAPSGEGAE